MATLLGLAITGLTSKVGVLSRKACIRLATETGEKVLTRKNELGRNLNAEEIEQVWAEVLPKKCRPKAITTEAEVMECLRRSGASHEQISAQIKNSRKNHIEAATIGNGTEKYRVWIPENRLYEIPEKLKVILELEAPATIAHETEHALEKNCRVIDIIRRKTSGLREFFGKLLDENYMEKLSNRQLEIHDFEAELQRKLKPIVTMNSKTGAIMMNCEPTIEAISERITRPFAPKKNLKERLRETMRRNYASSENTGSEQDKRFRLMKYWMDMERPAYEVTGQIERKIFNLQEGEYAVDTGISKGYEAAIQVVKQERKNYWINKLFGKLKKPNVYAADKDILMYAETKEEKVILTDIMASFDKDKKSDLIKFLYETQGQKDVIVNLQKFLEATKVNGKSLYAGHLNNFVKGIKFNQLSNPDFIKIIKLTDNEGLPAYRFTLQELEKATPERLKEFTKLAGIKDTYKIKTGLPDMPEKNVARFRYMDLAGVLNHPNFNELKAFADIQLGGEYIYSDWISGIAHHCKSEDIKALLAEAQKAAKDGNDIFSKIDSAISKEINKTLKTF